ncbi:hypothetical protein [Paenibacillus kribbensis]|uniref:hypothetical protein n=1 Tax=Paenibacillus kribbensis TaxID=172713 RepID=UPI00159EF860|nr:hypothetical protein [Paenibacillus kribbensis]
MLFKFSVNWHNEQWQKAEYWLYRAIAEAPHLREPYTEMACRCMMNSLGVR